MVKPLHFARLAAFPIGLGLTSVLVGGTLNRVMIVELGLPVALVGFLFAVPLLVSPLRVWLGYRSDAFPLLGLRRVPYIVFGWWLAELGVVGALWLVLRHPDAGWLPVLGMVAAFAPASWGFGGTISHVLVAAASGSNALPVSIIGAFAHRGIAKRDVYILSAR